MIIFWDTSGGIIHWDTSGGIIHWDTSGGIKVSTIDYQPFISEFESMVLFLFLFGISTIVSY